MRLATGAGDANELARPEPPRQEWPKAKVTIPFGKNPRLVFQAAVQAVRGCRCEIVQIDWANYHLRFSLPSPAAPGGEHDLFVFDTVKRGLNITLRHQK